MVEIQTVAEVLNRFANSFDLKDWWALGSTLADEVVCDYRDLRGDLSTYSREQYLALREEALGCLKTQHLFTNLEIEVDGKDANCRVNALILRQGEDERVFTTHAIYFFTLLQNEAGIWQIKQIRQQVLWNDGDRSLHAGAK